MIAAENFPALREQSLFESIAFKINRRERVAGRPQRHGKTTLFRLIVGSRSRTKVDHDPRHYRIGYVRQEIDSPPRPSSRKPPGAPRGRPRPGWRVEKILAGSASVPGPGEEPGRALGGYQVRLNLTKVLLADYNMLLLDEPNNYLDIVP